MDVPIFAEPTEPCNAFSIIFDYGMFNPLPLEIFQKITGHEGLSMHDHLHVMLLSKGFYNTIAKEHPEYLLIGKIFGFYDNFEKQQTDLEVEPSFERKLKWFGCRMQPIVSAGRLLDYKVIDYHDNKNMQELYKPALKERCIYHLFGMAKFYETVLKASLYAPGYLLLGLHTEAWEEIAKAEHRYLEEEDARLKQLVTVEKQLVSADISG